MLLDPDGATSYRQALALGLDEVHARVTSVSRPCTGAAPADLDKLVRDVDLDAPLADPSEAIAELGPLWLDDAVWFHHPDYAAHLNCPVEVPALLGELLLSAVNPSLDTWDQSIGATLMERRLVTWTADRAGLGEAADGVFTSGGTQSNLQALLVARGVATERLAAGDDVRLPDLLPRLRVLASEVSHFSVRTGARTLGLGEDAVVPVACDERRRMRPDALAEALAACRADGLVPMAVVATAGTTDFGSIDPMPEIAELCRRDGVWMHVDAAFGGGLLCSTTRRHLLDGIEHADSVTVDFHKTFFQPVSSSAVLVRNGSTLRHVTHHADYLNPADTDPDARPNQVDKSIQTTRRFDALKLWLTLRLTGADGVGAMLDTVVDLADATWRHLDDDPRFEVVVRPTLSTVVFRYRPDAAASPAEVDDLNTAIRDELFASGRAMVARTVVDGRVHLKLTLLNPRTTAADLRRVLDLVARAGDAHLDERSAA
ncbi:pyridoxal phosphate-dependent decarboxylase family protein [Solicola sp. PLA-1-18]|uniref:pyridoxal phosphate-dependent decarboxylase family protein n=1 Tax=Solicola sp. PLA-1-18 TaxID=3380532 RepID=UPI003B7DB67F